MRTKLITLTLLFTSALFLRAESPAPPRALAREAVIPTAAERDARLGWWREAKFGMFIHWGLYSVAAGEYNGKLIPKTGEWIMWNAKIPFKEYQEFAAGLTASKFDADAWAQLAQDAGMKYLCITTKHHDGFAMYPSKIGSYNITERSPFKRDPILELSAACAKRGIRFCLYYSQAIDWENPNGMGNTWDFGSEKDRNFDEYLEKKSLPQVKEILAKYKPAMIWFDLPRGMTRERANKFAEAVRQIQPDCIISGRLGPGRYNDYDSTGDNSPPKEVKPGDWETPATLNNTWGYKKQDHDWKNPAQLVFWLVDIVSKGGNYLLNVGPTAEGVIPQPSVDALHGVGRWMKVNGEAIHGAKATCFGDEFGKRSETEKNSAGKPVFIVNRDWRCTTKPPSTGSGQAGKLYIHIFNWPTTGKLELPAVKGKIVKAYMLANPQRTELKVTQSYSGVSIALPGQAPDPISSVLCLETDAGIR